MTRIIILVALCVCAACFAVQTLRAETYPLGDVLSGKAVPLTITYASLTPEWRLFSEDETPRYGSQAMPYARLANQYKGLSPLVDMLTGYYTRGDMATSGGETFLIVYQRPSSTASLYAAMEEGEEYYSEDDNETVFENLSSITPESPLALCLFNVRETGKLLNIRQVNGAGLPDMKAIIAEAHVQVLNAQALDNLSRLAMAMMMYSQEHDEKLPEVKNDTAFAELLDVSERFLTNPVSHEKYRYNMVLCGKSLGDIDDPMKTPVFYDPTVLPEGGRNVAFVNGHIEKTTKEEWAKLQVKWGLP